MWLRLFLRDFLLCVHLALFGLNLRAMANELITSCKDNYADCVPLDVHKQIDDLVSDLPLEDNFVHNLPYKCYLERGTVPYMEWCIPCSDVAHGCARDGQELLESWIKVCRFYCSQLYSTENSKHSASTTSSSHHNALTSTTAAIETGSPIKPHAPSHFSDADIIIAIVYVCLALLSYLVIIVHYNWHRIRQWF